MEYVYSAMLLHSAGKEVTEAAVSGVLKAAGVEADSTKVKALIASLKDVNIDEAVKAAAFAPAAPAAVSAPAAGKKEEKKEEDKGKSEEAAAEGLGALFG